MFRLSARLFQYFSEYVSKNKQNQVDDEQPHQKNSGFFKMMKKDEYHIMSASEVRDSELKSQIQQFQKLLLERPEYKTNSSDQTQVVTPKVDIGSQIYTQDQEVEDRIIELKNQIQSLQGELQEQKISATESNNYIFYLEKQVEELKAQLSITKKQSNILQVDFNEMENQYINLNEQLGSIISQITEERQCFSCLLKEKDKKIEELSRLVDKLSEQVKDLSECPTQTSSEKRKAKYSCEQIDSEEEYSSDCQSQSSPRVTNDSDTKYTH